MNKWLGLILAFLCLFSEAASQSLIKKTQHVVLCTSTLKSVMLQSSYISGIYLWNTGDTSRSITVCTGGSYVCRATYNRIQLEEVFEVAEKYVPRPPVISDFVLCQGEQIKGIHYQGLLWYDNSRAHPASGIPTQPDVTQMVGDFYLYVAQKEGSCFSEKLGISIVILPSILCHPRRR